QARGGQDAKARLQALVAACLRLAVEERAFWIVFVEFWGEMMHDRRLREINAALYERMRRLIGAGVVQGVRAGTFRRTDGRRAPAGRGDPGESAVQGAAPPSVALAPGRTGAHSR